MLSNTSHFRRNPPNRYRLLSTINNRPWFKLWLVYHSRTPDLARDMLQNPSKLGSFIAVPDSPCRRSCPSWGFLSALAIACALLAMSCGSSVQAQLPEGTPAEEGPRDGAAPQNQEGADDGTPETTKPEATKPEATKPEATKPETTKPETTKPETRADGEPVLKFTFEGASWRGVIDWLAEESRLALHVGSLPSGSFTYSDPNEFTPQQAIDRVNVFLLPHGFTLVRSGQLLSVINLSDPRGVQQLEALAETVSIEQLDGLDNHTVVRCFFPLGEFATEDAVEELSVLKLMTTPAILSKTNQLLITDTAGKLKSVKTVLAAFQPSRLDNGTVMKNFALKHVDAEDFLDVARPHLGLATGEMIGIDVSLSADLRGKNIFVTGVSDKVKLVEDLVAQIDIPEEGATSSEADELRSHFVKGGNVETVYNVLLTLLSGKTARLSMDEASGSVIALASPEIQAEIAQTVLQLQAADAEFAVITLKTIDPYFAISLLTEMLELDAATDESSTRSFDDRSRYGRERYYPPSSQPVKKAEPPRIDADPVNMRLFVRGQKHQIEQIRDIVAQLDVPVSSSGGGELRILPLRGNLAERAVVTAARFWRGQNPIILFPPMDESAGETERSVSDVRSMIAKPNPEKPRVAPPAPRLLTENAESQAPAIRCQLTPRGLILQCSDTEALDKFEEQLQAIVGPIGAMPSPPIVFYLKYAKVDDAIRMLAELLDGGEAASESATGSLVNGYVSSSGGLLGSFVSSRDGMTTLIADTVTVVADSRLNRLVAQGSASDIERIESYLKIIDKDISITSIETYGTSHLIELKNSSAIEVAAAIREVYGERVLGGAAGQPGRSTGAAGTAKQPQRDESAGKSDDEKKKASEKEKTAAQPKGGARDLGPKMTVAVHIASNSLIVTAPDQLWREVEALAKLIDSRNERAIQILAPDNPDAVHSLLQQVITSGAAGSPRPSSGGRSSVPSRSPKPSPTRPQSPQKFPSGR